jgi:isoleucyl-tRNA synthetase
LTSQSAPQPDQGTTLFQPVPSKVDFPLLEREILSWWEKNGTMHKYLQRNNAAEKRYSFIDGPITANNPMGVHHAWGRTYKDLYQRYKTMQGFQQRYQNGFDGQGLWIEVEVERELGFNSKRDIEAYGIDRFVDLCKARVHRFSDIITEQSIRLGYWMDWDNSYHTMADDNNYTIWHFLKTCHERGWLYQGKDVMPWCTRCGTGLSEHEIVTEGYREVVHPGLFLRFPLADYLGESLLVWTTTPWTTSSNVAAAVHPELSYVKIQQDNEILYLAKARISVLQGEYQVLAEMPGKDLVGLTYHGPFDELSAQQGIRHRVIPWEEVTESEGTGIVHIAPGAGKEDFALGRKHGLEVLAPLDESGIFLAGFGFLEGSSVNLANDAIFASLREKGLLYHLEKYAHRYPVCWRCDTELVFRLVDEWFISMDELRHLIAEITRKIKWIPTFGLERELDWLRNMDDWMISKKRYWGLALPIYLCECGHFQVVGDREELKELAIEGWATFEDHSPHRPWIDAVKISCPKCKAPVSRIKDVGNPWLDAGIVPFSTLAYRNDPEYWKTWFPADWISESFPGQFRNWFYSLLTMSTVLENEIPFRTVFSYALMRDEKGAEMHKSKGNAIWLEDAAEEMGVDAMRWQFLVHNPANNINFGYKATDEVRRRLLIPLWNVYSFFVTYANIDEFNPNAELGEAPTTELDRWILSELHRLITDVTGGLENYDAAYACRRVEEFVEGLSNWYVRRSRRRFWKAGILTKIQGNSSEVGNHDGSRDKLAAYQTLFECLTTLTRLLAPFVPFFAEELYQNLIRSVEPDAPESVHLTDWPKFDENKINAELSQSIKLAMHIARLGRAARSKAGVKVRQPIPVMEVRLNEPGETRLLYLAMSQILDELNVKRLVSDSFPFESNWYNYQVRPNQTLLGPKYGSQVRAITDALAELDPGEVAKQLQSGATIQVGEYNLLLDEVTITKTDLPGWVSATEGGYTVRLSTELTADLEREGLARELVHRIQNMRRAAGFDIADRIITYYQGSELIQEVFGSDGSTDYSIKAETLSTRLVESAPPPGVYIETQKLNDTVLTLAVQKMT